MTDTRPSHPVHPSKRDAWLVALVWAAAAASLFAAGDMLRGPGPPAVRLPVAAVLAALAPLLLWLLYGTRYTVTDSELLIRCGPLRSTVPLRAIRSVQPTRSPLSSPACSLDRLHIRWHGSRWGVMVSPQDKARFLDDLAARVPGLHREGPGLRREDLALRRDPG